MPTGFEFSRISPLSFVPRRCFSQCHSALWELCRAAHGFNIVFMDGCKSAIVPNSLMSSSSLVRLAVNVGDTEMPQAASGV